MIDNQSIEDPSRTWDVYASVTPRERLRVGTVLAVTPAEAYLKALRQYPGYARIAVLPAGPAEVAADAE